MSVKLLVKFPQDLNQFTRGVRTPVTSERGEGARPGRTP